MGFADLQTFYEESTHICLIPGLNKHPGWLDVDSDHFEIKQRR
jgi:hypothetical protein